MTGAENDVLAAASSLGRADQHTPDTLADSAWDALAHPDAAGLTYACRRLLGEAALGAPLIAEARRTAWLIVFDILADADISNFDDMTRH